MRRWAAARPLVVREAPSRQTSVWREACQISVRCEACPPARRPRRELRSARRLEARPGPAGLAPLSSRAAALRHRRYIPRRPRTPSDRAVSPDERDKTLPARNPADRTGTKLSQQTAPMGPPGTKLSQHTTKRRYQAISRLQGELCTAQSTNKPSRENFVPHTGPLAGQNSPHTKPGGSNRYKTLPAGSPYGPTRDKTLPTHHKTAIPSHFSLAGRTFSRLRQRQAEQGELCTAHRTTCGTKLSPLNSSAEATGQNSPRSS